MESRLFEPKLLQWAFERSELPIDSFAKKLDVEENVLTDWFSGAIQPSISKAKQIAKVAHIPMALLLLKDIPTLNSAIPDFRTKKGQKPTRFSPNLQDTISFVKECQNWYKEFLENNGYDKNLFVGCLSSFSDPKQAAKKLLEFIDIEAIRQKSDSPQAFLTNLIKVTESKLGVCVMRSGHYMNDTTRNLDASEFRGFAITDSIAPFIFLNTTDAIAGQTFSLLHELVHIARNQSCVSNQTNDRPEEKYANEVAGICLMPSELVQPLRLSENLISDATAIAKRLKVSTWAVLTRALHLQLLSTQEYKESVDTLLANGVNVRKKTNGGNFYQIKLAALGRNLSFAIITSVRSGDLLYRDMWKMIGVKPGGFSQFSKAFGPL